MLLTMIHSEEVCTAGTLFLPLAIKRTVIYRLSIQYHYFGAENETTIFGDGEGVEEGHLEDMQIMEFGN